MNAPLRIADAVAEATPVADHDDADFSRAVRTIFGLTRSFFLAELGPRGVMLACRDAKPRSAAERAALAELHARANRLAERDPPARRLNY